MPLLRVTTFHMKSIGGLIYLRDGANSQYAVGTAFLLSIYSDVLAEHHQTVQCGNMKFESSHLMAFAKQQVKQRLFQIYLNLNGIFLTSLTNLRGFSLYQFSLADGLYIGQEPIGSILHGGLRKEPSIATSPPRLLRPQATHGHQCHM